MGKNVDNLKININGKWFEFEIERDFQPSDTLAFLLREKLGLTGLKIACDEGACGACTVLMDGKAILSCMTLAIEADGHEVQTIESLDDSDPVVESFAEQSEQGYGTAMQCGFCTPGFIMATKSLLNEISNPSIEEVKQELSGNICRCGCYSAISQAVLRSAEKINFERKKRK